MTDMKIQDLKWRGLPMWPPEWLMSEPQIGEEGVLEDVELRRELSTRLISIEANHLGDCRKGIMVLEDPAHLQYVFEKLRENLGRPLAEIANLEIDFTPAPRKYGPKPARPSSTAGNMNRAVNKK
jgi:hypothetical protein